MIIMITKMEQSTETVLGFEVRGRVSVGHFDVALPEIEKAVKNNDKINLLFLVGKIEGYGVKEFYEDIKFAFKYWNHISKLAIVSNRNWWGPGAKIDNLFTKWEERYFDVSELDKAWSWVKQ